MEIKKCPYCGGWAEILREPVDPTYWVQCSSETCSAGSPIAPSKNEAIRSWNFIGMELEALRNVVEAARWVNEAVIDEDDLPCDVSGDIRDGLMTEHANIASRAWQDMVKALESLDRLKADR